MFKKFILVNILLLSLIFNTYFVNADFNNDANKYNYKNIDPYISNQVKKLPVEEQKKFFEYINNWDLMSSSIKESLELKRWIKRINPDITVSSSITSNIKPGNFLFSRWYTQTRYVSYKNTVTVLWIDVFATNSTLEYVHNWSRVLQINDHRIEITRSYLVWVRWDIYWETAYISYDKREAVTSAILRFSFIHKSIGFTIKSMKIWVAWDIYNNRRIIYEDL